MRRVNNVCAAGRWRFARMKQRTGIARVQPRTLVVVHLTEPVQRQQSGQRVRLEMGDPGLADEFDLPAPQFEAFACFGGKTRRGFGVVEDDFRRAMRGGEGERRVDGAGRQVRNDAQPEKQCRCRRIETGTAQLARQALPPFEVDRYIPHRLQHREAYAREMGLFPGLHRWPVDLEYGEVAGASVAQARGVETGSQDHDLADVTPPRRDGDIVGEPAARGDESAVAGSMCAVRLAQHIS